MKSMEGSTRIRPANGRSSRSVHGVGRERESETRGRTREWVRVDGEEVLDFNAAYGMARDELDGRHVAAIDEPRSRSG